MLTMFIFAFSVTIPIFAIVLLGLVLKRIDAISDEFIRVASNLVFNVGLPVMLFVSSVKTDFSQLVNVQHIVVMVTMTLLIYFLSSAIAFWQVKERRERGVYVQGAFRGNLVIVGLAFCANAYGESGLAIAALPTAISVIVYNVLSVYVLNVTLIQHSNNILNTLIGIIKNPLIIGIVAGLMVNLSGLPVPNLMLDTGSYLSSMTLPLALLCIGGTLNLMSLRESFNTAMASTAWKLIASPIIVCLIAVPLGIRNQELAVLFLLAASPTAVASFIMVKAMGGNSGLAANIVLLTTIGSVVTVTGGLLILKFSGLI
ncbi:MAG: AEC family transporter [Gammaproteobacteria bacterium]|nr:AEC family transporter [Gammaproteobacteria bacterium]